MKLWTPSEEMSWVATVAICILLWVILAKLFSTSQYIPSPLAVGSVLIEQGGVFLRHFMSTTISSVLGFTAGSFAAIVSTLIAIFWEPSRRGFSFFAMVLYSIPLIAAAPLTALLFGATRSGIVLGCIGAYLPIFLSGLRAGDRASSTFGELVKGYGATTWDEKRYIRLPLVVRGWMVGAESGWMWAVLGALLGDFTGGRWGLGTFLVGTLSRGEPSRVWAIVTLCLTLSSIGLVAIRSFGRSLKLHGSFDVLDISLSTIPESNADWISNVKFNILNTVLFLFAWQFCAWTLNVDGGIFSGPIDLFALASEISQGRTSFTSEYITSAFYSTMTLASIGVILSLLIAFIIATGQHLTPLLSRPIVLVVLITQVTPIVAFVPLIAFYFGRGSSSVIIIVILSTIYHSYIIFLRALEDVPQIALDVIRGFGGGAASEFIKVRIPHVVWMSVVALRLAVGRAMLGAITAEYLITGDGIGGLLGQTRALLDFRVVWFICAIIALVTLAVNSIISIFEKSLRPLLTVKD